MRLRRRTDEFSDKQPFGGDPAVTADTDLIGRTFGFAGRQIGSEATAVEFSISPQRVGRFTVEMCVGVVAEKTIIIVVIHTVSHPELFQVAYTVAGSGGFSGR